MLRGLAKRSSETVGHRFNGHAERTQDIVAVLEPVAVIATVVAKRALEVRELRRERLLCA